MYCYKCGRKLNESDKFCPGCGTRQSQPEQQVQAPDYQPEHPPENLPDHPPIQQPLPYEHFMPNNAPPAYMQQETKKKHTWLWVTLASVAALIVIITSAYFLFFRDIGHMTQVGRALNNLSSEVEERFDHTPFKALTMLGDILEDGTVTTIFNYRTSIFGGFLTTDIEGNIKLSSNINERDFALEAQVGTFGQSIELDAYMNRDRLALRVPIVDNNYYGITYDTFRDDIRVFGRVMGLDNQTMDLFANIVDQINVMMNDEGTDEDFSSIFNEAAIDFARNLEISSTRTNIATNRGTVNCTHVEITISKEALLLLLTDVYDIFENNEDVKEQFTRMYGDNPLLQGMYGGFIGGYDRFMREFETFITDFENNYSGDIVLSFYIDRSDRLLFFELNVDIVYNYYPTEITATFDFGDSVTDFWTFDIEYENLYTSDVYSVIWGFEEKSSTYTNTITASTNRMSMITLISEWNVDSGDFALVYIFDRERNALNGVFLIEDKNFVLAFDDMLPNDPNAHLLIEILAQTGAQIDDINYINMDKWGNSLVESVMRLILGGIFY